MSAAFLSRLALAAAMLAPLACSPADQGAARLEPELAPLRQGTVTFRPGGEFLRAGRPVDAPETKVRIGRGLAIMKHQVTVADYRRCVAAGACAAAGAEPGARADHPVVNVSWRDARAYAAWLSAKTGQRYRLPTDAEWAYAAGSRYRDEVLNVSGGDPAQRWIARYERESRAMPVEKATKPVGAFGANEKGLFDFAGNVWEWTDSCFVRVSLDAEGRAIAKPIENCGVRLAAGRHRAYVPDFIRDARSGGCAVGIPPSNLGFRLVREADPRSWLRRMAERVMGSV